MKFFLQILTVLLVLFTLLSCTSGPSGLLRPNGVALAPDGSLYVMDRGHHRVIHLSAAGRFLGTFGRLGTAPDDIYSGWDLDLDSAGNIYLCHLTLNDSGAAHPSDGVKVFSPEGHLLRIVGEQIYDAAVAGVPNTPYGVDIDKENRIYVTDFDAGTIRVFNAEGDPLAIFPGETGGLTEQFKSPTDVAVDDTRGLLYVVDSYYSRVQQYDLTFDAAGSTLRHRQIIGDYGHNPGQFAYPQNIVVDDQSGWFYVSDMGNHRIQVFNSEGRYLTEMAAPVNWQVLGLDVGADGAVYAADAFNNLIWVFEPNGQIRYRFEVSS